MKYILFSVVFLIFSAVAEGQELKERLYKAGFEQVQILEKEDTLVVFFEHRSFRNPYHSFQYALGQVGIGESRAMTWVPLYHNRPMGAYRGEQFDFRPVSSDEMDYFQSRNKLGKGYRFHFRLVPDFSARFGRFDNPYETKTNIILDSRIYLLPGLSVQSGVLVPLQNSLDAQENNIRLAPSHLHYFTQWRPAHFLSFTIGTFFYNRYGLDLQYRYDKLDNRWSFGVESGFTGYYYQSKGGMYREPLNDIVAVGDVEYRLPISDISLRLSAGQFLFSDKGVRADLIRQFGGVDIGFFVSRTQNGTTGGFQFAFSLFPGTIIRSRKLELRTTEEFRWEYSYSNEALVARKYRLGIPRLNDQLRQYNAIFVKNQIR